jgi:hypothetical protein
MTWVAPGIETERGLSTAHLLSAGFILVLIGIASARIISASGFYLTYGLNELRLSMMKALKSHCKERQTGKTT